MELRSIKRSKTKRNAKSEKNKQLLVNMPIDVLVEIFPYLEPLDLLHLSRTTKGLRAFLLSRDKSSTLWKSAIKNVDNFPACPDHISAPAYTYLAFVQVCHGCFGPCETVQWDLRMRCCSNCWENMTDKYPPNYPPRYAYLRNIHFPTTSSQPRLIDDRLYMIRVTLGFFPPVCSRLDLNATKSHKRPNGGILMDRFIDKQNSFFASIRTHAQLCRDWETKILRAKAVQLRALRDKRIQDIKDMLLELGWEASDLFDVSQLPEVEKLEPLTPADYVKIRPRLIRWIEEVKQKTRRRDCIRICRSAISGIQEDVIKDSAVKVKPEDIDIAMLPAVRSMLESSVHSEFTLDDAKNKLSRVVPQMIRRWSSDAVEELESFAREQLDLSPLSKPSRLPSVIFRCKQCSVRLSFDEALSHFHLYRERDIKKRNTSKFSIHEMLLIEYKWLPRDIDVLQVDISVSRRVENLIRRMGKNPSRVTYEEMCRSPVKVACCLCRSPVNMDFKTAFDHCLIIHFRKQETEMWTRISTRKVAEMSDE